MNCKPGDLAIVTKCPPDPSAVGMVVECVKFLGPYLVNGVTYPDVWSLRWGDNSARELYGYEGWGCRDAWLKPLRDPGDDATDETLLWLPIPSTKEPA